ncbi:MAG TPA: hypothetical protein VLD36_02320 [Burkholderiales bacterium]|nr:hypothetical protein [Burkholderiales bacterium]
MKRLNLIAAGIALALAAPLAAAQGALDGRKYIGDIGPAGKSAEDRDAVITFSDNRLHSSVCDKYGFDRGIYLTRKDGDAVRFEAVTYSYEYGRNHWQGVMKGDVIEGTLTYRGKPTLFDKNPPRVEKWFKAKLM